MPLGHPKASPAQTEHYSLLLDFPRGVLSLRGQVPELTAPLPLCPAAQAFPAVTAAAWAGSSLRGSCWRDFQKGKKK